MKRNVFFITLLVGLVVLDSLGQAEVILDHKLPSGWKFKSFAISHSGVKALYLFQDLPQEVLFTRNLPKRLQVFDKANNLINDLIFEDNYWLDSFTRDDGIILYQGDESGCYQVKVIDLDGKARFIAKAEGRWPGAALLGHDIALVSFEPGPCSIIDAGSGREKLRYGPIPGRGESPEPYCFLPIGENGMYIVGIRETLFLKSYLHREKDFWKIDNVGGDIIYGKFLDDELLAVGYERKDFNAGRFMAGVAVIKWRTGKILFDKQGFQIDQKRDAWYPRFYFSTLFTEDGDLVFFDGPSGGVRIPRNSQPGKGWDEGRLKRYSRPAGQTDMITSDGKHVRPDIHGKYVIFDFGDAVRIEKVAFIEDPGTVLDK